MKGLYLGTLNPHDPLHALLAPLVLGGPGGNGQAILDVYSLDAGGMVYGYAERATGRRVVGKFYGGRRRGAGHSPGEPDERSPMQREYEGLMAVRALGFDRPPYRMVRPLTVHPAMELLVEEYVPGVELQCLIRQAAQGEPGPLHARLEDIVAFLAALHERSQRPRPVAAEAVLGYFERVVGQLSGWGLLGGWESRLLHSLGQAWRASGLLGQSGLVLVHGDVTPANFLVSGEREVSAIDGERVRWGDRLLDIGCLVAELKHLMGWYTGDLRAGEPFVQQVYRTYAQAQAAESWQSLVTRGRFFMGCYLLRICRNTWLESAYRQRLIGEAIQCLTL